LYWKAQARKYPNNPEIKDQLEKALHELKSIK
jgi:hypothetical protein